MYVNTGTGFTKETKKHTGSAIKSPLPQGIKWTDIESLVKALAEKLRKVGGRAVSSY